MNFTYSRTCLLCPREHPILNSLKIKSPVYSILAVALIWPCSLLSGCSGKANSQNASTALQQGWSAFQLGDYKIALSTFDELLKKQALPEDIRLLALFGKATVWDLRQPVTSQRDEMARELYGKIIREAPTNELAAWSSLALARMSHLTPVGQQPDLDQAEKDYERVVRSFPKSLAGQEALIRQQSILIQSLDPKRTRAAIARLLAFIKEQPDSAYLSQAYTLLAQGYETLDEPDAQLDARLKELETLEVEPTNPLASDRSGYYWQIAVTAEFQAGRFDVARVYYQKLIEEYPLDFRKFGAKQALVRMACMEADLRKEIAP